MAAEEPLARAGEKESQILKRERRKLDLERMQEATGREESANSKLRREKTTKEKRAKATPDMEAFGSDDSDNDDDWEVVQETHCHLELPDCPVKVARLSNSLK